VNRMLVFIVFYLFFLSLMFVSVQVDIFLNPWLKDVQNFNWWNYFTTQHALTLLWLHGYQWVIFVLPVFPALFLVLLVFLAFSYEKERGG